MDREPILKLIEPVYPTLLRLLKQAYGSFDDWIPASLRPGLEVARAKLVNARMLQLLELEFGRSKRKHIRMAENENKDLTYLFVEGDAFDVGIRVKKLDENFKSFNHSSDQQDELRKGRCFPCMDKFTAHIFLGYRQSNGLQPELTHITLSSEGPTSVDWKHFLWTAEASIPLQEYQETLLPPELLPPESKIIPKQEKEKGKPRRKKKDIG